jgi:hypothetical protein
LATTIKRNKLTTAAFALSLVAGILILIQGIVRSLQGRALDISGVEDEIRRRILAGIAFQVVGVIAIVFGIIIIVGAVMLYQLGQEVAGGLIVLLFSLLSILTFGVIGLVGLILGVIGAALAFKKKKRHFSIPYLLFFN